MDEIKAAFIIDREIWNEFKKVCKENETDASKEIRKFIKSFLKEQHSDDTTSDKIKQEVFLVDNAQKRQLLQYIIKQEKYNSILVFVKTKDDTESVLEYIKASGISCDNIHRNRSQNARIKALTKLKN